MKNTFRGGVHPNDRKAMSRDVPLRVYDAQGEMVFPVSQHIGKPAKPVVKKNDQGLVGQVLAQSDGFVSASIVSSCSGKVKAIEKRRVIGGAMVDCIVVDNDGQFNELPHEKLRRNPKEMSGEEILSAVADAGIVGMGGAGFPTHVKLKPRNAEAIKYVIANGAECEPYLTCNDQLMRTKAAEIVEGMSIILQLFPNAEGVIGIEDNKPEAITAMTTAAASAERVRVLPLKTKYPQGGERSLISVIAGVDFPTTSLPADVGCIVDNVATILAVRNAVCFGEPLIKNVVTVTGEAVKEPCNLIVRVGTSLSELLEAAGGVKDGCEAKKALAGGPMMGLALGTLDVPTTKTTNGLTVLAADPVEEAELQMTACLRCGRCGRVCPMGLLPQQMSEAAEKKDYERYEKLYGPDCIACGTCTFICPAKRPLMQLFKQTKAEILAKKRAEMGGKK